MPTVQCHCGNFFEARAYEIKIGRGKNCSRACSTKKYHETNPGWHMPKRMKPQSAQSADTSPWYQFTNLLASKDSNAT